MDCRQAWNLMMKSFDNEISQHNQKELNTHIDACNFCKTKFEKLNNAFIVLETTNLQAPSDIEEKVMANLGFRKHKRDFLLPYVIFNLIVFVGIVATWLDNLFRIGIYAFLRETFNKAVVAYNTSATVLTTFQNFFNIYFIKPTRSIALIGGLIYAILSIISAFQKMRRKYASAR